MYEFFVYLYMRTDKKKTIKETMYSEKRKLSIQKNEFFFQIKFGNLLTNVYFCILNNVQFP